MIREWLWRRNASAKSMALVSEWDTERGDCGRTWKRLEKAGFDPKSFMFVEGPHGIKTCQVGDEARLYFIDEDGDEAVLELLCDIPLRGTIKKQAWRPEGLKAQPTGMITKGDQMIRAKVEVTLVPHSIRLDNGEIVDNIHILDDGTIQASDTEGEVYSFKNWQTADVVTWQFKGGKRRAGDIMVVVGASDQNVSDPSFSEQVNDLAPTDEKGPSDGNESMFNKTLKH